MAAFEALRLALPSGPRYTSGTTTARGGFAAAMGEDDSLELQP
jgi:hypothetical protein